jgi:hypothetical protein
MPRRYVGGTGVFPVRQKPGVQKPRSWAGRKEKRSYLARGSVLVLVCYRPFQGLLLEGIHGQDGQPLIPDFEYPSSRSRKMKKISLGIDQKAVLPILSSASKILAKCPRFCEFLTATAYEDGSMRRPGRFWFESDGVSFTLTLFELSAALKMRCRAQTIDDTILLAETFLGAENGPWEVDQYEWERQQQKNKKKK